MPSGLLSGAHLEFQADLHPRSSWSAWAARTPRLPQLGWYGAHAVSKSRLRRRLSVFSGRVARNGSTCPWLNSAVPPREPGNRMRPPQESTDRVSPSKVLRKAKIKIGCPVPLTVRGTQALVGFAPLAPSVFCAARQNAVLRRSLLHHT